MNANTLNENVKTESQCILCSFWLANRLFGVDIQDVKEINNEINITPVFHAPAVISGYMNIRGQIHLVIDLRKMFGFPARPLDGESRVILFKSKVDEAFGVLVDRMDDVIHVEASQVEERRKSRSFKEENVKAGERRKSREDLTAGVCKLEKGLLVVLNSKALFSSIKKDNSKNLKTISGVC